MTEKYSITVVVQNTAVYTIKAFKNNLLVHCCEFAFNEEKWHNLPSWVSATSGSRKSCFCGWWVYGDTVENARYHDFEWSPETVKPQPQLRTCMFVHKTVSFLSFSRHACAQFRRDGTHQRNKICDALEKTCLNYEYASYFFCLRSVEQSRTIWFRVVVRWSGSFEPVVKYLQLGYQGALGLSSGYFCAFTLWFRLNLHIVCFVIFKSCSTKYSISNQQSFWSYG